MDLCSDRQINRCQHWLGISQANINRVIYYFEEMYEGGHCWLNDFRNQIRPAVICFKDSIVVYVYESFLKMRLNQVNKHLIVHKKKTAMLK